MNTTRPNPDSTRWMLVRNWPCGAALVLTCLALAPHAPAQTTIPIANSSFESPETGGHAPFTLSDWQLSPSADAAVTAFSSISAAYNSGVTAPDGAQVGLINDATGGNGYYVFQDPGAQFATGLTYTFSAYFGRRLDNTSAAGELRIYKTDNTSGLNLTLLASSGTINPTAGAAFQFGSVSYTASALDDLKYIRVAIVNASGTGQQINFDMAQLTSVPEPSTYAALAGLGAFGIAAYRRRRGQGCREQ